ncbi:hypothetical protein QF043_002690 [Pseudomonas sp. W3I7]|uniref:hypothetical protein n=1 Tax=Pseudomonas sp. W3I7 TaxID=3042292 RepID=UPI0027951975|nr:hypothetical protein [Pseudomonas sp. W3I7]MDQ0703898.1 hypothetical protein [Pseudomonas sp. W3I7]
MELVKDLNGDGRPDALITEGSTDCYGQAGTGFYLVSQQSDGRWKLMLKESGVAEFLASKGSNGWPDVGSAARAFVSQYCVTTGNVIDFTTMLVNGVLTSGKRPMAQSSNEGRSATTTEAVFESGVRWF